MCPPHAPQAESEAEERQLLEQATAQEQAASAARRAQQAETELSPLAALVARVVAFFQALQRWFQTLVAFVTGGGSGSGSGSAAGASA